MNHRIPGLDHPHILSAFEDHHPHGLKKEMPRYFPQSWAGYDRDHLVMFLCLAMVFFFILHHLAEKAITICADRGASALLKKTDKLVLFANQQEKAVKAYQLYSESVAAMVFVFLSLSLLGFVYPLLFSGIMGFLAMVATLSFLGVSRSAWLQKLWEESYAEICKTLSTAGFLGHPGRAYFFSFSVGCGWGC